MNKLNEKAKGMGLRLNIEKMMNSRNQDKTTTEGHHIDEVEEYTNLGALVCKEGGGGG